MSSLLDKIYENCRSGPQRIALHQHDKKLSYAELWDRASTLAELIKDCAQTQPARASLRGAIVGLQLRKSPDFVVAMLATWMCRAAFVPIDPELPRERREFIARDAGLALLLCENEVQEEPPLSDIPILSLTKPDAIWQEARGKAPYVELPPPPSIVADDLAYLIYTSGSTGSPKGVEVEHRGLLPVLSAQVSLFQIGPESRLLWLLSPSFDASQSDIGCALLAGACLQFPEAKVMRDPERVFLALDTYASTHVDIPPSILRLLPSDRHLPFLQTIVIGGEVCPPRVVRHWAGRYRVVNVYGPTETTICTSMILCDANTWNEPMLGLPIAGVDYRVEEESGDESSPGTTGELLIGGVTLARGYRNLPKMTHDRFVFRDGKRFFRSGDLVRVHPNKNLEFVGRADRQFKQGGVLVAPEEIETAIRALDFVEDTLVRQEANARLIAYCTLKSPERASEIRPELARRLPPALVPSQVVACNSLPRTLSGKIDANKVSPAPSADLAVRLEQLWCEVLGLDLDSLSDKRSADFFALGGSSLQVVELLAAAREQGLALSAEQLYRAPCFSSFVEEVRSGHAGVSRSCEELDTWAELPTSLLRKLEIAAAEGPQERSDSVGEHYFLTGATGFLGGRLLLELLRRTQARISLLLRCKDEAHGWQRLQANLKKIGEVADPNELDRCDIVIGDIRREHLGLAPKTWQHLKNSVTRIYHCAASVHLLKPLEDLAASNIRACIPILELMAEGCPKELHYASTLSVFVGSDRNAGVLREGDDLRQAATLYGGYAQSKWAAERLLEKSAGRAGPVFVYRFGLLVGDPRTNRQNPSDWLSMYVRSLPLTNTAAVGEEWSVDLTPVGFAAAAMAHLSVYAPRHLRAFHIANPKAASHAELQEAVNVAARELPTPTDLGPTLSAAIASLGSCRGAGDYQDLRPCDVFQATGTTFDAENTLAGLAGSGIDIPEESSLLVADYVRAVLQESPR